MPFVGAINPDIRAVLAEVAAGWKDLDVYVGCSGNFTAERLLNGRVRSLHSNDVSLYSCALGSHLTGKPFRLAVKDPAWQWLESYMGTDEARLATLLLCTSMLPLAAGKARYHARMVDGYRTQWSTMHAQTVEKVHKALDGLQIASFHPVDVVDFVAQSPPGAAVVAFPPTYCLAPYERILTSDLRWVPTGQLEVGDELLAFDEHADGQSRRTPGARRRHLRLSTVTHSRESLADCVRVHLADGTSVDCTADHPWLAGCRGVRKWIRADRLVGDARVGPKGAIRYVRRVFPTWEPSGTRDAGWLGGMFDGEGSFSYGPESTHCGLTQAIGPEASRVEAVLLEHDFKCCARPRELGLWGRKPLVAIEISGGFREQVRALGVFQPSRLIRNFRTGVESRALQSDSVAVERVEPIGIRPIQSISTSTGTYIGEGFAMHNTKGYEKLYEAMERVFDWDPPSYEMFDDARFDMLVSTMRTRPNWLVIRDKPVEALDEYLIGRVQASKMAKPTYIYAATPRRVHLTYAPEQQCRPVLIPRLSKPPVAGPLRLVRLDLGQFNTLRAENLNVGISPASVMAAAGVLAGEQIVGCFATAMLRQRGVSDVFMSTDFAVQSSVPRLAKLVLAASVSTEAQVFFQDVTGHRCRTVGTTVFTERPVSAKYRGLYDLYKRGTDPPRLLYRADLGRWSLEEAFDWWMAAHGPKEDHG